MYFLNKVLRDVETSFEQWKIEKCLHVEMFTFTCSKLTLEILNFEQIKVGWEYAYL